MSFLFIKLKNLNLVIAFISLFYGEGSGTPLQYSCLENPMDRGACWAAVHGVAKSRTWLSDFTLTFHFHALEKEMATHSGVLAWRILGTGEPGGLLPMRSHRVGHNWSDLASLPLCFKFFSHIDHYRILSRAPCATQQVSAVYFKYSSVCAPVWISQSVSLFSPGSHKVFEDFSWSV